MKRWAVRIFVLLLLGTIVNVAVAWMGLSFAPIAKMRLSSVSDDLVSWVASMDQHIGRAHIMSSFETTGTNRDSFLVLVVPSGEIDGASYSASRVAAGWPIRSLLAEACINFATQQVMQFSEGQGPVPLRLLWPGFAINTVFYAAVLWGLFVGPFALRRRMRIERGLCPKCAYDLRGIGSPTCPECGVPK